MSTAVCYSTRVEDTSDLENLKFMLNQIAEINADRMHMELLYADVVERYRTLKAYDIEVPPEGNDKV